MASSIIDLATHHRLCLLFEWLLTIVLRIDKVEVLTLRFGMAKLLLQPRFSHQLRGGPREIVRHSNDVLQIDRAVRTSTLPLS